MEDNYRINSYTFGPFTKEDVDAKFARDNLLYAVEPELHGLLSVWAVTQSYEDNDLSGIIADMMEERSPHFKSRRHKMAWRILREFMTAIFNHRTGMGRPSFSAPDLRPKRDGTKRRKRRKKA